MAQTAYQYAKDELAAERFPVIDLVTVCGETYLADRDGHLLAGRAFASRDAAMAGRSKALDRARKAHWAA